MALIRQAVRFLILLAQSVANREPLKLRDSISSRGRAGLASVTFFTL